jgi:hypothetical protein
VSAVLLQAKSKAACGKLMCGIAMATHRLPTLLVGTPICMLLKARQTDVAVNQLDRVLNMDAYTV